ncbi:phosphatidylinositol-4-phosphate 5-kinase, putative [Entamoeba invadens IP1]|uniref:Phosphatidylinositol-4-phosphate 5-kinase, putative n=1 Tax=Entamoeba invadens IP1 TaxID=370355 RepID=A0A0A1TWB3_ENTIV|nr:phosphatidylinositol-4-phosphate 5-kinase, putative [Entamoeba invadens IP1]ELP84964.1 phosphatidylinositol-4-phosphate 5-kinase, putative [Entamoeba invadens IP1]|eukprot:XP_004184310.1 phosphatidylinositol-4-phosphate 5-kinase, putative [Entamoeba invadens IP1]
MNNLFPNTQFPLQFKFDLKGSLYGRKADENERGKKSPCYKDIDFLDQKAVIKIGPNLVNAFKTQVEKDSELMSDMHLIDYSLLVGVHQLSDTEMETAKNALDKQKQRNSKKSQHKHKHKHNKKTHNKSIKDDEKETNKIASPTDSKDDQKIDKENFAEIAKEDELKITQSNQEQKQDENSHNEISKTEEKSEQKVDKQSEDTSPTESEQKVVDSSIEAKSNSKFSEKEDESKHPKQDFTSPKDTKSEKKASPIPDDHPHTLLDKSSQSEVKSALNVESISTPSGTPSTQQDKPVQYRPRRSTVFADSKVDELNPKKKMPPKVKKDKVANPEDFLKSLKIPKPEDFIFVDYEGGLLSRDANGYLNGELYFIGIIDILMDYTTRKKLETVMKGAVAGGVDQVSSVSPQQYSKRFIKFVHDHTN